MRSYVLSLLAFSPLAACTGKGDDSDGDTHPTGDTVGVCGAYMGQVGSTLTYTFTETSQMTGTTVVTFTSLDAGTGEAVFDSTSNITTAQSTSTTTTVQNARCQPDGVHAVSITTDYSVTAGGQMFTGSTDTTYDPPFLLLPADVAVGSDWDMSTAGTTTDSNSGTSTFSISQTASATGMESVTVPAGTYTSLAITYTPSTGDPFHAWIASGVGTVKTDSTELSSVR